MALALVMVLLGDLTAASIPKTVRFIYLVSGDRQVNPRYTEGIAKAARNIQAWYKNQMNGFTFRLNEPIVEVVKSSRPAAYFYSHPNGKRKDDWGYNNAFAEVERLVGAKHFDRDFVYVIYSDGPGNSGRGGSGVAIMPEDDLLGLIGEHSQQKEINRWIGGLGHELGHALGLPHPKDMRLHDSAIMARGIYNGKYPEVAYLTPEDKAILGNSRFFFNDSGECIAGTDVELARFSYAQGSFVRQRNSKTGTVSWVETTRDNNSFEFSERIATSAYYQLKSVNRNLEIRIPVSGGQAMISTDSGRSWRAFQVMTQAPSR